jgi:hypothetical protein
MKTFVKENWYKLMVGSSMMMASFGFMMHSVSPATANESLEKMNSLAHYGYLKTNSDGSINVKLTNEQIKAITPPVIQNVNIEQVRGVTAAANSQTVRGENRATLATCSICE